MEGRWMKAWKCGAWRAGEREGEEGEGDSARIGGAFLCDCEEEEEGKPNLFDVDLLILPLPS